MSGHYRPASKTPFKWRFAGGMMVAPFKMLTAESILTAWNLWQYINSLPTRVFAKSLGPDQVRRFVGPVLDPSRLNLRRYSRKEILKKKKKTPSPPPPPPKKKKKKKKKSNIVEIYLQIKKYTKPTESRIICLSEICNRSWAQFTIFFVIISCPQVPWWKT